MLNRRSLFVVTGYTGDVFNCRFLPRSSSLRTKIDRASGTLHISQINLPSIPKHVRRIPWRPDSYTKSYCGSFTNHDLTELRSNKLKDLILKVQAMKGRSIAMGLNKSRIDQSYFG